MPCYYTGSAIGDAELAAQEAREQVTKLTQLLCLAGGRLEKAGLLTRPHDPLRIWYEKHKQTDEHRRKAEKAARRKPGKNPGRSN